MERRPDKNESYLLWDSLDWRWNQSDCCCEVCRVSGGVDRSKRIKRETERIDSITAKGAKTVSTARIFHAQTAKPV